MKANPFRLAAIAPPVEERTILPARLEQRMVAPPRPEPAHRREKKPAVDLETIRVLLYLSTSPRITAKHRDACRRAAELLR